MFYIIKYFNLLILICLCIATSSGKENCDTADLSVTTIPVTLSAHPIGLFDARIHYTYRTKAIDKPEISINISNGNVWLPLVKSYIPKNEADRAYMQTMPWHYREDAYYMNNMDAENFELHADGIYRVLRLNFEAPVSSNQDISLEFRSFTIDGGFIPWSSLTSDDFIEWVHTNIHGGEDPFARKIYGLHHAEVRYVNEKEETMSIEAGDFIIPGFQLAYNYYPESKLLNNRHYFLNTSIVAGFNTSKINRGIDLGGSFSIMKEIPVTRNIFTLGCGLSILRKQLVNFRRTLFINYNKYLYTSELYSSYKRMFNSGHVFTFATNMHIQTAYRNRIERDYLIMTGNRYSSHWNHAASHLYRPLLAHSFIFSYSWPRFTISCYAREDFLVDNAPDAQTGVELRYAIR